LAISNKLLTNEEKTAGSPAMSQRASEAIMATKKKPNQSQFSMMSKIDYS
jgi:hypothetical protein